MTKQLGVKMPVELREVFESMAGDLGHNGHRLDVVVTTAPEQRHSGHCVRTVQGQNAEWYRNFAARFTANRTKPRQRMVHDTLVKRRDTRRLIERWLKNGVSRSKYAEALIEAAEFEKERMAEEEAYWEEQMAEMDAQAEESPVPVGADDLDEWDDVPF